MSFISYLETKPKEAAQIVEDLISCRKKINPLQSFTATNLKEIFLKTSPLALQELAEQIFPAENLNNYNNNNENPLINRIAGIEKNKLIEAIDEITRKILNLDGNVILNLSMMKDCEIFKFEDFKKKLEDLSEYFLNEELRDYKGTKAYDDFKDKISSSNKSTNANEFTNAMDQIALNNWVEKLKIKDKSPILVKFSEWGIKILAHLLFFDQSDIPKIDIGLLDRVTFSKALKLLKAEVGTHFFYFNKQNIMKEEESKLIEIPVTESEIIVRNLNKVLIGSNDFRIMFQGPTGNGKSSLIRWLQLMGSNKNKEFSFDVSDLSIDFDRLIPLVSETDQICATTGDLQAYQGSHVRLFDLPGTGGGIPVVKLEKNNNIAKLENNNNIAKAEDGMNEIEIFNRNLQTTIALTRALSHVTICYSIESDIEGDAYIPKILETLLRKSHWEEIYIKHKVQNEIPLAIKGIYHSFNDLQVTKQDLKKVSLNKNKNKFRQIIFNLTKIKLELQIIELKNQLEKAIKDNHHIAVGSLRNEILSVSLDKKCLESQISDFELQSCNLEEISLRYILEQILSELKCIYNLLHRINKLENKSINIERKFVINILQNVMRVSAELKNIKLKETPITNQKPLILIHNAYRHNPLKKFNSFEDSTNYFHEKNLSKEYYDDLKKHFPDVYLVGMPKFQDDPDEYIAFLKELARLFNTIIKKSSGDIESFLNKQNSEHDKEYKNILKEVSEITGKKNI